MQSSKRKRLPFHQQEAHNELVGKYIEIRGGDNNYYRGKIIGHQSTGLHAGKYLFEYQGIVDDGPLVTQHIDLQREEWTQVEKPEYTSIYNTSLNGVHHSSNGRNGSPNASNGSKRTYKFSHEEFRRIEPRNTLTISSHRTFQKLHKVLCDYLAKHPRAELPPIEKDHPPDGPYELIDYLFLGPVRLNGDHCKHAHKLPTESSWFIPDADDAMWDAFESSFTFGRKLRIIRVECFGEKAKASEKTAGERERKSVYDAMRACGCLRMDGDAGLKKKLNLIKCALYFNTNFAKIISDAPVYAGDDPNAFNYPATPPGPTTTPMTPPISTPHSHGSRRLSVLDQVTAHANSCSTCSYCPTLHDILGRHDGDMVMVDRHPGIQHDVEEKLQMKYSPHSNPSSPISSLEDIPRVKTPPIAGEYANFSSPQLGNYNQRRRQIILEEGLEPLRDPSVHSSPISSFRDDYNQQDFGFLPDVVDLNTFDSDGMGTSQFYVGGYYSAEAEMMVSPRTRSIEATGIATNERELNLKKYLFKNDTTRVLEILTRSKDFTWRVYFHEGKDLFLLAALSGWSKMLEILTEHGPGYNFKAAKSQPLCSAVYFEREKVVRVLLNQKANVNERTVEGYTALHLASHRGNSEIVRMLLQFGARVTAHTRSKLTAFHLAVQTACRRFEPEVFEVILHLIEEDETLLNAKYGDNGITSLGDAILAENLEVVDLLLKLNADPNIKLENGRSLMTLAYERREISPDIWCRICQSCELPNESESTEAGTHPESSDSVVEVPVGLETLESLFAELKISQKHVAKFSENDITKTSQLFSLDDAELKQLLPVKNIRKTLKQCTEKMKEKKHEESDQTKDFLEDPSPRRNTKRRKSLLEKLKIRRPSQNGK